MDGRDGLLWPSAVARVLGPAWGHAAMGWTPPVEDPLLALPTPRPAVANWPSLLEPPPGPQCRCRLGERIFMVRLPTGPDTPPDVPAAEPPAPPAPPVPAAAAR
eukprot:305284-Alexandrium_andersonii.AAC.1